jgi:hypothetical protein
MLAAAAILVGTLSSIAAGMDTGSVSPSLASRGVAKCPPGSKRAVVGGKSKCLRTGQACARRYERAYKKYGFTCVNGRLRKRTAVPPPATTPAPTPTPPAPPPAPPTPAPPTVRTGHYHGLTSQLTTFDFDVTAGGTVVTNLVTGQINQGCNPPGVGLSQGNLNFGSSTIPVSPDGRFVVEFDYQGMVDDLPSTGHITVTGQFSGSSASGNLSKTSNFTYQGTAYSCGSGLQTWKADLTG